MTAEDLAQRLAVAENEIGQLRQLVLRAYEDTQRAAAALLVARRDPGYEQAFGPQPLVSIRIGAYRGGERLFERALASVLRQSYPNWEAIVVCDGRDQETARRVEALDDARFRCVQRPRNGPYPEDPSARWLVAGTHPFNQGVALARGDWIAPLDQDDEWTDDHLEILLEAGREVRAEVVYGVGRALLAGGGETYFGVWPPAVSDFGFQTAIYHSGLAAAFLYDVNSHLVGEPADWNLARRMLEAGVCFEFVDRVVTAYYIDDGDRNLDWWRERERRRGAFGAGQEG